jgi:hypothetical protein
MGIREAFYMTFSYKEIRLCLAIGLAMLIVKGYGVQVGAGRSAQDGRPETVGVQQPGVQQPAVRYGVQREVVRYGDKAPFVPHLFCAAVRFQPTDQPFSEVSTHFKKVIHRAKSRVVPSGCG